MWLWWGNTWNFLEGKYGHFVVAWGDDDATDFADVVFARRAACFCVVVYEVCETVFRCCVGEVKSIDFWVEVRVCLRMIVKFGDDFVGFCGDQ